MRNPITLLALAADEIAVGPRWSQRQASDGP